MTETELIRQARNKYYQEYRKRNPEKIRRYNEQYWLRKAKQVEIETEEKSRS